MLLSLAGLAGFALDDMTQDDGWRLLMLGRRLERLQFLSELLALRLTPGAVPSQSELEWLLDIGDSTITYRTRYLASPLLGSTIDLLVFDKTNPRALAYQWGHIEYSLVRIAASLGGSPDDSLDEAVAVVGQMELNAIDGDSARAMRARQALGEQLDRPGRRRRKIVRSSVAQIFLAHRRRDAHGGRMSATVRYRVRHETAYAYGGNVAHSHQLLHLTPRDAPHQTCHRRSITLEPQPSTRREDMDAFGNHVTRLEYDLPHDRLQVLAEVGVDVRSRSRVPCRGKRRLGGSARCLEFLRQTGDPRTAGFMPLPDGVELRQDQVDVHRLWRGLLPAVASHTGRGGIADEQDLSRLQIRAGQHQHPHVRPRSVSRAQGRVPGFCPHHARMSAFARSWLRATSAVICGLCRLPGRTPPTSGRMRRMRGSRFFVRHSVGWTSIPPTTCG